MVRKTLTQNFVLLHQLRHVLVAHVTDGALRWRSTSSGLVVSVVAILAASEALILRSGRNYICTKSLPVRGLLREIGIFLRRRTHTSFRDLGGAFVLSRWRHLLCRLLLLEFLYRSDDKFLRRLRG